MMWTRELEISDLLPTVLTCRSIRLQLLQDRTVVINRAPVMLAWATAVAERLGFTRQEALSIGESDRTKLPEGRDAQQSLRLVACVPQHTHIPILTQRRGESRSASTRPRKARSVRQSDLRSRTWSACLPPYGPNTRAKEALTQHHHSLLIQLRRIARTSDPSSRPAERRVARYSQWRDS